MTNLQLRLQVANQCRAVAELASALAEVHRQVASAYEHGNGDTTLDMVGRRTAGFMETLGDWLNNMDAAEVSPDWLVDVFAEAQRLYPQQDEPSAPRDQAMGLPRCGICGEPMWHPHSCVKRQAEPTRDPTRCSEPGCGNMGTRTDGKCGYHTLQGPCIGGCEHDFKETVAGCFRCMNCGAIK